MSKRKPLPPIVADKPLTIETIGTAVVVEGPAEVVVALTPDAAVETGVEMIRAGLDLQHKVGRRD